MSNIKYAWLNVQNGEFSNTWCRNDFPFGDLSSESEEEFQQKMENFVEEHHKNQKNIKLIKFECVNDSDFEFTSLMKIK